MKLLKILIIGLLLSSGLFASNENPTEEEVSKLYIATFNRAADSAGLKYWINTSGLTLKEMAKSFFVQTETAEKYPAGTTNRAFIRSVYLNLFNREPDEAGWNYWESELNSGVYSRDKFILVVINGATDSDAGQDATILLNKNEVGLAFANAGFGNNDFPTEIMSGITENKQTVSFILGKISSNSLNIDVWSDYTEKNISSKALSGFTQNLPVTTNKSFAVYAYVSEEYAKTLKVIQYDVKTWYQTASSTICNDHGINVLHAVVSNATEYRTEGFPENPYTCVFIDHSNTPGAAGEYIVFTIFDPK